MPRVQRRAGNVRPGILAMSAMIMAGQNYRSFAPGGDKILRRPGSPFDAASPPRRGGGPGGGGWGRPEPHQPKGKPGRGGGGGQRGEKPTRSKGRGEGKGG